MEGSGEAAGAGEPADATDDDARRSRRRVLTATASAWGAVMFSGSARAGDTAETTETTGTTATYSLETTEYALDDVPTYYEDVDLGGSSTGATYELLLRDKRFGLAGNTVTLRAQTATSGGPKTLKDIGSVEDVAERLVKGENAKSKGGADAEVRSAATRKMRGDDGEELNQDVYEIVYEKSYMGVRRVVQVTLALDADPETGVSTLYTLTLEKDVGRYDAERDDARAVGAGFRVRRRQRTNSGVS